LGEGKVHKKGGEEKDPDLQGKEQQTKKRGERGSTRMCQKSGTTATGGNETSSKKSGVPIRGKVEGKVFEGIFNVRGTRDSKIMSRLKGAGNASAKTRPGRVLLFRRTKANQDQSSKARRAIFLEMGEGLKKNKKKSVQTGWM